VARPRLKICLERMSGKPAGIAVEEVLTPVGGHL
jgi:hypothetical protein